MSEKVQREFLFVGVMHEDTYDSLAEKVPLNAQNFMSRLDEIPAKMTAEAAFFEPAEEGKEKGTYFVGVLVEDKPEKLPDDMEFLTVNGLYGKTAGPITSISSLHQELAQWLKSRELSRDDDWIIECYHPAGDDEIVEIYLPVKD
ncbi:GyrI-like domain-containing protein [Jeotgalibacillus sp. R-1-5s-1]|uniref:GyrI-like domain-containing protein n=1 Tax=Jeotgalibacillus sp. R-1-5s-1 TaxID=2555897 RepID=UPI00106C8738|nr:GyrI-like domain-containing protein [Jeotgalibacillus sp. R-1-5s-1]TFE00787.1 hypothetical protein E2491_04550 [Jeotgalibacillus sp. R-1-5s-1]